MLAQKNNNPSDKHFNTLVDLFQYRADHQLEQSAYVFLQNGEIEAGRLTYSQLNQRAKAISIIISNLLEPGDRAMLLYPPGLDFIAAFLACLYSGVVAVPVTPLHPVRPEKGIGRLKAIAAKAGVKALLSIQAMARSTCLIIDGISGLENVPTLITDRVDDAISTDWKMPELTGESLALLQFTSGSTAEPRGVMVSHSNILHNLNCLNHCQGNSGDTRSLTWLPHFHDMGLLEGLLLPTYGGFPVTIMSPAAFLQRPLRWLKAISDLGITNSGGPNFAYELCLQKIKQEQKASLDLHSWKIAYNGAEPIRAATLNRFIDRFAPCGFRAETFRMSYGLAESTLLVAATSGHTPIRIERLSEGSLTGGNICQTSDMGREVVSCGKPWLDIEVAIVDGDQGNELEENQVGEIWVHSKSVAQGYWQDSNATQYTFGGKIKGNRNTWLRTGDTGFMSKGELFITGRLKEIIIIRGRKLFPHDIELTVEQCHPLIPVNGVAVISLNTAEQELLVIVAEVGMRLPRKGDPLEQQAQQDLEMIIGDIREAVAYQHEIRVSTILLCPKGAVRKTSSGKVQRFACLQDYLSGNLSPLFYEGDYLIKEAG